MMPMKNILKRKDVEKIKARAESMLQTYGPHAIIAQGSKQKELYDLCATCLHLMDRVERAKQLSFFKK